MEKEGGSSSALFLSHFGGRFLSVAEPNFIPARYSGIVHVLLHSK